MLNYLTGRNLTVRQRLMTLGASAVLGITSMLAVGWYENVKIDAALDYSVAIRDSVETINEMRLANANLVLAAMDTIIDRGEGTIQPERLDVMNSAIALLRDGSSVLKAVAADGGLSAEVASYDADLEAVARSITVDLKQLVETGADDTAYAAIDDTIDGAGERLANALSSVSASGGNLVEARIEDATSRTQFSLTIQLLLGGLALVTVVGLQLLHGNAIANGIRSVGNAMQRIVDGDYQTPVEAVDRADEIGGMARAADVFRKAAIEKHELESNAREARRQGEAERETRTAAVEADNRAIKTAVDSLADGLNLLSEGNLDIEINTPFPADLERLRNDFNQVTQRLQHVMGEISGNSSSIRANSHQMRSAADDLANRTEKQAASLEQTSAALDEITATVRAATERAEEASHMVDSAKDFTEKSGMVVNDAMAAMERIEDATGEIGKIINVIDEIAFQTNLLALNAGVEAARAGDAGKGFAVVAQEVRALAGRAADAARDIKSLVGRSSDEVKTGVELVTATGEALHRIGEDVLRINEHVKAIVTSAREQSVGLNEINSAVGQMDQVTQQNAAMVEETNAASHTLASDAENLSRLVSQFKMKGARSGTQHEPQPVNQASIPRPSPAKALIEKVAGTFNRTAAAGSKGQTAASEHWEEF